MVRLFEIAHAFVPKKGPLPDERTFLALAALEPGDDKDASLWRSVRGHIEAALHRLRIAAEFATADIHGFAAGKSAEIRVGGKRVGVIGYAGEAVRKLNDLRGALVLAELDLAPILAAANLSTTVIAPPDQPAIERDLSVVFDEAVRWSDVESLVRKEAGADLESLAFADLYRGKQVPAGKKSLMFQMIFRASARTLTGEEVDTTVQRIVAALKEKLGGELR